MLLNVFGLAEARVDADAGGKLEKSELVLAYPQASGVFTPIFVADDAGLFKKYGLDIKLQQQTRRQLDVATGVSTVSAFLKGVAEGVARTKNDPAAAKRAIGKFTKTDDSKVLDDTHDFYAPYFVTNLALRPEQLQSWFSYLDEKEYPQAAKAKPSDFYDNSLVAALEKSGFFQKLARLVKRLRQ